MNIKTLAICAIAATTLVGVVAPTSASAQVNRAIVHRNQTANEWKSIATVAGAVGIIGALNHDSTLTFAGTAGALYSLSRYEADRRSSNRLYRLRAAYFSRPYFYRNGHRYNRIIVIRHGHRYYRFVRV